MSRVLVDSGIDWIGKIPNNWNLLPLRSVVENINEKNNPIKFTNILSLTNKLGVVPYEKKGNQGNISKEDITQYKIAYKDTVVLNSMNLKIGSVGYSNYDGCVSPVYYVLKSNNKSNMRFINYVFQSNFQKYLGKFGKGILEIREKISMYDVLHSYIPLPNIQEQKRIADYLDENCLKIDEIIKDNNKQIELLNEYKKVKTNEVVSIGFKASRRLEKNNNLFFPYIPQGWEFKKIKYIVNSISKGNGITKDDIAEDGDIQCVRYGEIYTKYDNYFYNTFSKTNINKISSPKYIKKGDIICTCTGELPEEIGKNVLYLGKEPCLVGGDIIVINHNQNAKYLNYLINCFSSQTQKSMGKTKLKVVHISGGEIGNICVPLPPIEEQKEIADFLDKLYMSVDKVIEYRKQIIEKLEEYKNSLIYECVTGKREV